MLEKICILEIKSERLAKLLKTNQPTKKPNPQNKSKSTTPQNPLPPKPQTKKLQQK